MIVLTVNGQEVTVKSPPDTPLLWVIRDELDLKGTKFGCGIAQCGACTVHLDGVAVRSCNTQIGDVGEAKVTTIEGLTENGPHPLQTAWVEEQVPQCGYCQSGQIMQAASLLADVPEPSEEDITAAMSGNLCRCMAYLRIKRAIKKAATAMGTEGATNG
ncbi:MAG: (2Fe-2S)-binding protein [Alphaproteobacteria bacterium]